VPDERARRVLARYDRMASERANFESHWQEVADYVVGRRDFSSERTPGTKRMDHLYDTTALHASGLLTVGLHSLLSNPATRWFSLATEQPELDRVHEVRVWLDQVEECIYRALGKPRRNFNGQMLETYFDLVNFGVGVLACEELPQEGPMYAAFPLMQFFVAEDRFGRIDTVVRRFPLSAKNARAAFGDRAGQSVEKALARREEEKRVTYLHVVQPSSVDSKLRLTGTRWPWESLYVCVDDVEVVGEGGYDWLPYSVVRWQKDAGSPYANGCPGMNALPEARMLNQMAYTVLRAAQKATDPPLAVPNEGVMRPVRNAPGGITYYDPLFAGGGNPIFPMPVDARGVGIGAEMLRDRQQKVQEHFLFEILSMIRDPRMTATQVVEISQNVMRVVAPRLGHVQEQLLEPIVSSAYAIELRAGRLPQAPPQLSGQRLRIVYQSPTARAQRASDVESIRATLADAQQYAQLEPDVLHNLDADEAIRRIAEFRGVPASCLRSMQDVVERRAAEAQQASERSDMAEAGAVAGIAKNAVPALQALTGGRQAA
jgi:hypothetical protein